MRALRRRQLAYGLAAELVMLLPGPGPLPHGASTAVATGLRFAVIPAGLAFLLARWTIDGRPAHIAFRSWVAFRLQPARLVAWRPAPLPLAPVGLGPIRIVSDERGARLRPAVIRGPACLVIRCPTVERRRRRTIYLTPQPGPRSWRGREIHLRSGQRVVIR
jgi:hypothetical protein